MSFLQDEEADEAIIVSEQILDEMVCICGQPQPAYGDGSAVSCDQCDDRFHGHCVYITPELYEQMDESEELWICPRCINKETSISHKTTQDEVMLNNP